MCLEPASNALGAPSFDATAITRSRIHANGSVDTHRIGKSLRRKGFDPTVWDDVATVEYAVNDGLREWVTGKGEVRIERAGDTLDARREWVSTLPHAEARISCGDTRLSTLADLHTITVSLTVDAVEGGAEVTMRTSTR